MAEQTRLSFGGWFWIAEIGNNQEGKCGGITPADASIPMSDVVNRDQHRATYTERAKQGSGDR